MKMTPLQYDNWLDDMIEATTYKRDRALLDLLVTELIKQAKLVAAKEENCWSVTARADKLDFYGVFWGWDPEETAPPRAQPLISIMTKLREEFVNNSGPSIRMIAQYGTVRVEIGGQLYRPARIGKGLVMSLEKALQVKRAFSSRFGFP